MENRCDHCGNPRHSWGRYARGWLAYHVLSLIPAMHAPMWLFGWVGDCIHDQRECRHAGDVA